jgi:hypothetical protein
MMLTVNIKPNYFLILNHSPIVLVSCVLFEVWSEFLNVIYVSSYEHLTAEISDLFASPVESYS